MFKKTGKSGADKETLQEETFLRNAAQADLGALFSDLGTSPSGKTAEEAEKAFERDGPNLVAHEGKRSLPGRLLDAFVSPFTGILFVLAAVSVFTDIVLPPAEDRSFSAVLIISTIVLFSGFLRFFQERRSDRAAEKLLEMIETTTCVERAGQGRKELPIDEVVAGDLIHLSAGDMIPADLRLIQVKDLFVSQSSLTGESEPVEKSASCSGSGAENITEVPNLGFMGTNVISGSASGIVLATGNRTLFGQVARTLTETPPPTSFEKGVNSVSMVLIRFMLVMVPFVLLVNGFTKGSWMSALLFAISVAVGLTPEMLPMIVTTCLAKGALSMSRQKVIVKTLNSIQNLGSIDILCTDKTGTLTMDKVILQYHLNVRGEEDSRVLRYAFLNSYYQTGLKNLMDISVIERTREEQKTDPSLRDLETRYLKVDEIPFDFERRRMSIVVENEKGVSQIITKGAVKEMLGISSGVEYGGRTVPLTAERKKAVLDRVNDLNEDGMRVIALARKKNVAPAGVFSVEDECGMTLIGYLAFLDPPKESAAEALRAMKDHGVTVKVLTGDNERVTGHVCRHVGLQVSRILLGDETEAMTDEELREEALRVQVFAKLTPLQKARVVRVLIEGGHYVGFLGDGINDAPAMKASDVGISVDTAVDVAKESADVILLRKDLTVLENGIEEGRRIYANMIKYIKMTASSNFGNVFSVLIASLTLPFLPMASVHLLILNMLYDFTCTAIPWDNVDQDYLLGPKPWDASSVGKFMLWIGPTSSLFDMTTFLFLYFVICPMTSGGLLYHQLTAEAAQDLYIATFQAGWFVESMWSQTLVVHMIRTPKIPFLQSCASFSLTAVGLAGICIATMIPFTPFGRGLEFAPLPPVYFAGLALTLALYMTLTTAVKKLYIRKHGELL